MICQSFFSRFFRHLILSCGCLFQNISDPGQETRHKCAEIRQHLAPPQCTRKAFLSAWGGARELPVSISSQIVWLWLRLLEFLHCLPVTKFKQVIPPFNTCEIDIENWKMFSIRRPVIIILNYTNCLISMCFQLLKTFLFRRHSLKKNMDFLEEVGLGLLFGFLFMLVMIGVMEYAK